MDIVHDDAEDSLRGRGRATTAAALKLDLGPTIVCMVSAARRCFGVSPRTPPTLIFMQEYP